MVVSRGLESTFWRQHADSDTILEIGKGLVYGLIYLFFGGCILKTFPTDSCSLSKANFTGVGFISLFKHQNPILLLHVSTAIPSSPPGPNRRKTDLSNKFSPLYTVQRPAAALAHQTYYALLHRVAHSPRGFSIRSPLPVPRRPPAQ